MEDVELYREPAEVLRRELEHLRERLKEERAEAARFKSIAAKRDEGLRKLVDQATDEAEMTASLVKDYRAAIKAVER